MEFGGGKCLVCLKYPGKGDDKDAWQTAVGSHPPALPFQLTCLLSWLHVSICWSLVSFCFSQFDVSKGRSLCTCLASSSFHFLNWRVVFSILLILSPAVVFSGLSVAFSPAGARLHVC